MIIVDTNAWRELGHEQGHQTVKSWAIANADQLVLSAIVLGEIYHGVALRPPGKPRRLLEEWLHRLEALYAGSILNFEEKAARKFGELAARSKRAGRNPGDIDMQIAAQAAAHGMALATRNVKDFEGLGIDLINPWDT
ncbi:MAG: PIN domain-containing protein [Sphingobium sp.]